MIIIKKPVQILACTGDLELFVWLADICLHLHGKLIG